jgi:hypothetical protein
MGLFSKKPSRTMQQALLSQANTAVNVFGYALQHKATNPQDDSSDSSIDLEIAENRKTISAELSRLIDECGLAGCTEAEIGSARLMPAATKQPKTAIEDAVLLAAVSINSINLICRLQNDEFPKYRPMAEMVGTLATNCCPGAAQMLGPELSNEILETWPHFARLFDEAKASHSILWPKF